MTDPHGLRTRAGRLAAVFLLLAALYFAGHVGLHVAG
jgi:hypothetical protein